MKGVGQTDLSPENNTLKTPSLLRVKSGAINLFFFMFSCLKLQQNRSELTLKMLAGAWLRF